MKKAFLFVSFLAISLITSCEVKPSSSNSLDSSVSGSTTSSGSSSVSSSSSDSISSSSQEPVENTIYFNLTEYGRYDGVAGSEISSMGLTYGRSYTALTGTLLPGADVVTNTRGYEFGGWVTQSNSGGGLTKITTMPGVANMILQAWWLEETSSSSSSSSSSSESSSSSQSSELLPITINFKRTDSGWSGQTPHIYVYEDGGNLSINGVWPGGLMTASDNGWFTYTLSEYADVRVIFYVSNTYRDPADGQPGFQALPGVNTYLEGVWTSAVA